MSGGGYLPICVYSTRIYLIFFSFLRYSKNKKSAWYTLATIIDTHSLNYSVNLEEQDLILVSALDYAEKSNDSTSKSFEDDFRILGTFSSQDFHSCSHALEQYENQIQRRHVDMF